MSKQIPDKTSEDEDIARYDIELLSDYLAHFECRVTACYAQGDHVILVCQVLAIDARQGTPLIFSQGRFLASAAP